VDDRAAEATLLRNLGSRQSELTSLLEECSGHWGFEDPIYRFYHQSFKVYMLQKATARIVRVLESLAPDRPLNAWFRMIVDQGTGRSFQTGRQRRLDDGHASDPGGVLPRQVLPRDGGSLRDAA